MNNRAFVEGCLLGDGSLRKRANMRNAYFITSKTGLEHLDRLEQLKQAFGYDNITIKPFLNRSGFHSKNKEMIWMWTRTHPELTKEFYRWYPNGVKVIPSDLVLSPELMASLFMDDGSSSWVGPYVIVSLYVQGFTINEIERFGRLTSDYLGVKCYPNYGTPSKKPRLVIREKKSVCIFMDAVRPYIVPSFAYKVKIPGIKEEKEDYNGKTVCRCM